MEFEEMKKIWDENSQQNLYAIDGDALKSSVIRKKNKAQKIANRGELVMIGALLFSFVIVMSANIYKSNYELMPLLLSGVMLVAAGIIYMRRRSRLTIQNSFDNSIMGDIELAITNASYQMKLSSMSRILYIIVTVFAMFALVDSLADWWKGALVLAFFGLGYIAARWEHKTFYASQYDSLKKMKKKLNDLEVS